MAKGCGQKGCDQGGVPGGVTRGMPRGLCDQEKGVCEWGWQGVYHVTYLIMHLMLPVCPCTN